MYAIVLIQGKQYKVKEGQQVKVDRLQAKEGSKVVFDKVLAADADGKRLFGQDAAKIGIKATVLEHLRDDKVMVLKYKKRKRYRKLTGHKQPLSLVKIDEIGFPGVKREAAKQEKPAQSKAAAPKAKTAAKEEKPKTEVKKKPASAKTAVKKPAQSKAEESATKASTTKKS